MSDASARPSGPIRIGLVGATGLIGRRLIALSSAGDEVRMVGVARREASLPKGAKVEMFVADPDKWGEVLEAVKPAALICALGTTWKKAGRDEAAFRAVDYDLIVNTAKAAHKVGIPNFVMVSSSGADARSKSFYMRTKGEAEDAVSRIGLKRVDILRPGLLKGSRIDDLRPLEAIAQIASPVLDPLLPSKWSGYRSIDADIVCEAAMGLALRKASGRFTHDNDAIKRAAREWRAKTSPQDE
ncbi:NAD(P)H-binding protein [Erythrobacter sp. SCSIO 43205]|uniref:NAD(P)H-binding protein n=1 Tax=Erythrobacter sp. SCSIO 43205 TaxID=2779361 RepID=UPI001CA7DE16|nr:NAD(P)H-binding protein [Erythrobacter sp. SCSIO 43205]UAB79443.1 NAD(P)H-binding protein [Erythrobacter sp. SCSIO 43205]